MKLFVAILALVACVFAEEWTIRSEEEINSIRCNCLVEHNMSAEQIHNLMNFRFSDELNVLNVRQFVRCVYEALQIYFSDLGWNTTRLAKQYRIGNITENEVKDTADGCIAQNPKGDKSDDEFVYDCLICFMNSPTGARYIPAVRDPANGQTVLVC